MRTIDTPPRRGLALLLTLFLASACGRILGIEGAHVDPILDDDQTQTTDDADDSNASNDENDTIELHTHDAAGNDDDDDETRPDASGAVDVSDDSDDTTAECISFDNGRVRLLKADGTLTPLPERDNAVR